MNKKVATYIMVPIVLLIWGVVIAKIFAIFSPNDRNVLNENIPESIQLPTRFKRDSFTIIANYRDPFYVHLAPYSLLSTKKKKNKRAMQKQQKIAQATRSINWNFIDYGGLVSNQKSKQDVALMQIHKQSYLMKKGDIRKELTLLEIFNDSVKISYQGVNKTIKK